MNMVDMRSSEYEKDNLKTDKIAEPTTVVFSEMVLITMSGVTVGGESTKLRNATVF